MNRTAMLRVSRLLLAVIIGLSLLISTPVARANGAVTIDLYAVSADGPGYTYDSVGQRVTITSAGDYIVTGGGAWNTLAVAADIQGEVNLTLQGVNIALMTESQYGTPLTIGARSTVNLSLDGENTLSASGTNGSNAGILVQDGSVLSISGSGTLDATGWGAGSGIGPVSKTDPTGTITVTGGTVTARGGQQNSANCSGSGIYGTVVIDGGVVHAYGGYATGTSGAGLAGTVTINDGQVVATGGRSVNGYGGAGIGGTVTIHGGDVTATGGDFGGAGIGGGYAQSGGTILIDGGSVHADGSGGDFSGGTHVGGAGIGGGGNGGVGGTITIGGSATVVARGNNGGAGIGGGSNGAGGSVTISGGQVNARGDQENGGKGGAGIGGGYGKDGGQIIISSGVVTAQGGVEAAGIGGTFNGSGGQITITGGQVTATGGDNGSGIGSGYNDYHHSNGGVNGGTIQITGGTVIATGVSNAAGIGAGYNAAGGSITIGPAVDTALSVTATGGTNGGAGIGGGTNQDGTGYSWNGTGGTITIGGGTVVALGKGGAAGIGGGRMGNAGNITITGGRVTASGNDSSAPGIGAGTFSSFFSQTTNSLTITGGRVYVAGNGVSDIGGDTGNQYPTTNTFAGGSIRAGSVNKAPTSGGVKVYKTAVAVAKAHNGGALIDQDITYFLNGSETGIKATTDESGYLYLWLPQGAATVLVKDGDVSYYASDTVFNDNSNAMTADQQTYEVSDQDGNPLDDLTLAELYEGYGSGWQETADVTVKNYGTMPLQNFSVSVDDDANSYFNFVPPSAASLAKGQADHFQITAKDGLAGGTYHATVTIHADNMDDVTLNITQVVKLYTVSFYNQSADPYAAAQVHYNTGVGNDWPADPEINGYDFTGWYNMASEQVNADTPITTDLYLESRWTPHIYTITYDLDGGSVNGTNPGTYTIEDAAITLIDPTREGYVFDGWSLNGSSIKQTPVTIPRGSSTDWTIKANWIANSYTVVYDGNGATSGSMAAGQFTYNDSAALAQNTFGRTGYSFAGWALSKDGAVAYDDSATVLNLSALNGDTVTLYALWTANKYTVVYNGNGANSGSMATGQYTYGVSAPLAKNAFGRTGYTFAGWALSKSGAVAYKDSATVMSLSSVSGGTVTMYAQWTANKYSVVYNGNGANSGSMAAGQFTYGLSATLAKNTFGRTGYTFAGWALSKDGAAVYSDSATVVNLSPVSGGTVTMYAQWTKIKYQITYMLAGGTVVSPNPASYDVETPTFTLRNPTRTGYAFAGWSGTGITGMSATITVTKGWTGNRAYTANWKINVSFVSNGGTAVPIKAVANDSLLSVPTAPTRTGYKFVGWYKNATFTSPWNFSSDRVKLPTTLYARWLSVAAPVVKPVTAGYTSIKLTWNAISGADKYEVWRATAQAGPYVRLGTVTTAVFADTGLTAGRVYYYKVLAVSQCLSAVQSGNPTVVSVKPVPATPVSVKAVRASSTSIQVTWAAVAGASGYELCRATSSSGVFSLKKDTTATAYTNTGLKAGSYSYYKVRAYRVVNGARVYSAYSVVVFAKP